MERDFFGIACELNVLLVRGAVGVIDENHLFSTVLVDADSDVHENPIADLVVSCVDLSDTTGGFLHRVGNAEGLDQKIGNSLADAILDTAEYERIDRRDTVLLEYCDESGSLHLPVLQCVMICGSQSAKARSHNKT